MEESEVIKQKGKGAFRRVKTIAAIILSVYTLLCLVGYLLQGRLIFWQQKLSEEAAISVSAGTSGIENIELKMKDGNKIRGWLVKNSKSEKSNLLIYFGANAEEVSYLIPKVSKLKGWSIALINYRGYGSSEGSPSEKVLYSDCLEIYDYFLGRDDINTNNIVAMGRSIGTGVATFLAEKRSASAVILVSPYDSIGSVVQKKCPIIPVNLLLKHKFDSISRAPSIKSPVLILVGTEDKLIPMWHSKRLAAAWGGEVTIEEIVGEGHNSLDDGEEYWNKIYNFLNEM